MTNYVIVDANSIIGFFDAWSSSPANTDHHTTCEDIVILKKLHKSLEENACKLIFPEAVYFACLRNKEAKKKEVGEFYEGACKKATDHQNKGRVIPSTLKGKFETIVDASKKEEQEKIDEAWSLVEKIYKHRNTESVILTEKLLLSSYKRGLLGKKPFKLLSAYEIKNDSANTSTQQEGKRTQKTNPDPITDIQPDCIIIESAKSVLVDKSNYKLYLVTNDEDFYSSSERTEIHQDILDDLKIERSFIRLSDFLKEVLRLTITVNVAEQVAASSESTPVVEEGRAVEFGETTIEDVIIGS